MCCEDPPPDFELLGPPPKPPWLHYNLHCGHDGVVLQHEGQSSASTNSGGVSLNVKTDTEFLTPTTKVISHLDQTESTVKFTPTTEVITSMAQKDSTVKFSNETYTPTINATFSGEFSDSFQESEQGISYEVTSVPLANKQQSGEALFSNNTLNTVAIVLFCLAVLFVIIAVIVLWHKRRLMQKQQIDHKDVPDECQYLYNYKVRGKIWRLPRVTMILRSKSKKNKGSKPIKLPVSNDDPQSKASSDEAGINESAPINEKGEVFDSSFVSDLQNAPLTQVPTPYSSRSYGSSSKYTRNSIEMPEIEKHAARPYSSLERGSSTTSGIGSDSEWRYQDEPNHYLEHGSPYRVRRLKRKGHRSRQPQEDGELGDAEGSVECLAKPDKKLVKEKHNQKHHRHTPREQRLQNRNDNILLDSSSIPKSASNIQSQRPRMKTQQFSMNPPKFAEHCPQSQVEVICHHQRDSGFIDQSHKDMPEEELGPSVQRGRKKKKRKRTNGQSTGEQNTESCSAETRDNIDNEIRESYA